MWLCLSYSTQDKDGKEGRREIPQHFLSSVSGDIQGSYTDGSSHKE